MNNNELNLKSLLEENLEEFSSKNSSKDREKFITKTLEFNASFNKIHHLDISNCELNSKMLKGLKLPERLVSFNCSYNNLTKLPKLPELLYILDCSHNRIEKIGREFGDVYSMGLLDISHNNISSLKFLRNVNFIGLVNIRHNKIIDIEELSYIYSNQIIADHNLITEVPEFEQDLENIDLSYNNIKSLKDIHFIDRKNKIGINLQGNPITKNMYHVASLNPKNIKTVRFNDIDVTILTLKKNTALFRSSYNIKDLRENYIGFNIDKNTDEFVLSPDHTNYYFTQPFNTASNYGSTTIICRLNYDVEVIIGLKPSNMGSKKEINGVILDSCSDKSFKTKAAPLYNECFPDEFVKKFPNVLGWFAPDNRVWSLGKENNINANIKHMETINFLKYNEYVSFYEAGGPKRFAPESDDSKSKVEAEIEIKALRLDRAELALFPLRKRITKDIITKGEDFTYDWILKNQHKYIVEPLIIVENNQDFESYKKIMDDLLSFEGYKTFDSKNSSKIIYHRLYRSGDGMYLFR